MTRGPSLPLLASLVVLLAGGLPSLGYTQATGTVIGRVTRTDGQPLAGVVVTIQGIGRSVATSPNGRYTLTHVPLGDQVLHFHLIGYAPDTLTVTVATGPPMTADAALEARPIVLGAVVVEGAARAPERMIDAAAAVDVVRPATGEPGSIAGQIPLALSQVPGLDVVQSGVNDFNVNARGFNATSNRKMLVLQDGRDLASALVARQTWGALSQPLEDLGRIEVIRGPGSALYGPNAYNGVISITTPPARDVVGTKLTLGGGERSSVRADLRHAGVWLRGRVGYRVNLGYARTDDWSRSRTARDTSDWREEYAPATSIPPTSPPPERRVLNGQTMDPGTGRALGTPDALVAVSGSARLDYYAANGSMFTVEGGAAQEENPVILVGNGRNQPLRLLRPWARVAWDASWGAISAWYSGLAMPDGQVRLSSVNERTYSDDRVLYLGGRTSRAFAGASGRVVLGASIQDNWVDTRGTILGLANDDRSDQYYGAFAQVEYRVGQARVIGALRWDEGSLFTRQLSPKGGVVFTVATNHALRLTVNRAFLTPTPVNLFQETSRTREDLTSIENDLRADPTIGPALAAVDSGTLFTKSDSVPVWAIGNPDAVPQTVLSYEAGYKGQIGSRAFVTVDAYRARVTNFLTGLLPAGRTGLNPSYPEWTAPAEVPAASRAAVVDAVYDELGTRYSSNTSRYGLSRRPDGTTAFVGSFGNVGTVDEWGVEVGMSVLLTRALTVSASYTWYGFEIVDSLHPALIDVLKANTPSHKGTVGLAYEGPQGITLGVDARFVAGYVWGSGFWNGYVPASQTVNARAGYRLSPHFRVYANVTNLIDQQRFHFYGASVTGRRVLAGITTTW